MTQQDATKKQEGAADFDSSSIATKVTNSTNAAPSADKRSSNPQTPTQKKGLKEGENMSDIKQFAQSAATPSVAAFSGKAALNQSANSTGKKPSKYQHGRQKNFYNPPGKVLRHLAQQSYYDNFYGNQGQFYTLKQKYKTQLCRHFTEHNTCPLDKYCQFAHGPTELRQANDVSNEFRFSLHLFTSILKSVTI